MGILLQCVIYKYYTLEGQFKLVCRCIEQLAETCMNKRTLFSVSNVVCRASALSKKYLYKYVKYTYVYVDNCAIHHLRLTIIDLLNSSSIQWRHYKHRLSLCPS